MKIPSAAWLTILSWTLVAQAQRPTPAPFVSRQLGGGFGNVPDADLSDPAGIASYSRWFDSQVSSAIAAYPDEAGEIREQQTEVWSYLGVLSSQAAGGQAQATGGLGGGFGAGDGGSFGSASAPRATATGSSTSPGGSLSNGAGAGSGPAGNSGSNGNSGSSSTNNGQGSSSNPNSANGSSNGSGAGSALGSGSGVSSNSGQGTGSSANSGSNSGGHKSNNAAVSKKTESTAILISTATIVLGAVISAHIL